jgi:hypothetical protein
MDSAQWVHLVCSCSIVFLVTAGMHPDEGGTVELAQFFIPFFFFLEYAFVE